MASYAAPVADPHDYLWIVVCGAFAAAFMAWGIGANDVANAFATSVGSRTLKLWQACVIAAVFEFLGCMVLGGETTKTISSDIAKTSLFVEFPEIYMYGMLCALSIAGLWLLVATYWCLAVSTTHTIVGAVMGFSIVYGGFGGVVWYKPQGSFPFTSGFLPIVLSWFFSPIIGGILSAIIFNVQRFCILRRKHATSLAIHCSPLLIFITLFVNLMFVLAKGANTQMQERWPCTNTTGYKGLPTTNCTDLYNASVWISAVVAVGVAFLSAFAIIPLLKRKILKSREQASDEAALDESVAVQSSTPDVEKTAALESHPNANMPGAENEKSTVQVARSSGEDKPARFENMRIHEIPSDSPFYALPGHYARRSYSSFARQLVKGLFYDVHKGVKYNITVQNIHQAAEVFKPETELIYQSLQVFSACCVSFAHGSNDVANSIGPFSAIYTVYRTWQVPTRSTVTPKWIFAVGGGSIVVGLMSYGYNLSIITTIGVNMLLLTPSRGFSAELAAGLTISLASFFGLPVSTTQIIIGAEVGVGLSENLRTGLHYRLLLKTFFGWIWTILLALIFTAALFSAGAYAPSIIMSQEITEYSQLLSQCQSALTSTG